MPASLTCPKCGAGLPENAPAEMCPKCLLQAGLESDADPGSAPRMKPTPLTANFVPPGPADLAIHFPQLEILELLGKGGMGAVYKARQTKLDRLVALKIIRPESAGDPAFAERFNREARTLARLNHPQIVAVHDFGEISGPLGILYYFIMEYVDGANLRQLIDSGQLAPEQTLAIVPQVCEALQYAHNEGVVHRDIKPENILLDTKGRVKIADFGLAKLTEQSPEYLTLTATHQVMGTPRYMAPEQMTGSHRVDHRADIYSLGVVFYEMLTGELPFGSFDPPSHKARVDARLDEVVLKALATDPDRRYQHAGDLKTDVELIVLDAAGLSGRSVGQASDSLGPTVIGGLPGPSTMLERGVAALVQGVRRNLPGAPAVSPTQTPADVRRQVRWPGIALMLYALLLLFPVTLLLFNGIDIADGNDGTPAWAGMAMIAASLCLLGLGVLVLRGGWHMMALEKHSAALLGSYIGQPVGLWPLLVLSRPGVKAAFAVSEPASGTSERQKLPVALALVLCVAGCLMVFLPWIDVQILSSGGGNSPDIIPTQPVQPEAGDAQIGPTAFRPASLFRGNPLASTAISTSGFGRTVVLPLFAQDSGRSGGVWDIDGPVSVTAGSTHTFYGSNSAWGIVAAAAFAVLVLLLIAIPTRAWRSILLSLLLLLPAAGALLSTVMFHFDVSHRTFRVTRAPIAERHAEWHNAPIQGRFRILTTADTDTDPKNYAEEKNGDWVYLSQVDHLLTYRAGFYGSLGLSLAMLVLSALGVRHAAANRGETHGQTGAPASRGGSPLARVRFSAPASTNMSAQVIAHFESYGYRLVREVAGEWVFHRGKKLAGLYEFDIRGYDTHLTVRATTGQAGQVWITCMWEVRTLGAMIFRRDVDKLEQEGHELEELLRSDNTGEARSSSLSPSGDTVVPGSLDPRTAESSGAAAAVVQQDLTSPPFSGRALAAFICFLVYLAGTVGFCVVGSLTAGRIIHDDLWGVFGPIVCFGIGLPSAIAGTILGAVALNDVRKIGNPPGSLGMALSGVLIVPFTLVNALIFTLLYALLLAVRIEHWTAIAIALAIALVIGTGINLWLFRFIQQWMLRVFGSASQHPSAAEIPVAPSESRTGRDWVTLPREDVEHDRLPDVCMVCGGPARARVNKTFDHQSDWAGALTFAGMVAGLFPGLIIAALTSKQIRVACPVCPRHRGHWSRLVWAASLGWLVVPLLGVAGYLIGWKWFWEPGDGELLAAAGIGVLVGLVLYLVPVISLASTRVGVESITETEVRFHRVAAAFANAAAARAGDSESGKTVSLSS